MATQAAGAVSGATSGAATGASIGNLFPGYGTAIGAAVGAVAGAVGGWLSSENTSSNAEAAQMAALQNASSVRQAGYMNATLAGMAGSFNANATMAAARLSAESLLAVNDYNTALIEQVTDYNVSLLEDELPSLLEEWELSSALLEQERARSTGSIIANQGASGTVIGMGSNAEVVIDNEAAYALDAAILRHNYDQQSTDVMNAIARSEWEGAATIAAMNFEAEVGAYSTLAQGTLNAQSIAANTMLSMFSTQYNANANADTILSQGSAAYTSGMNTASAQLNAGIISAIGTAASVYSKSAAVSNKTATTSTSTGTTAIPAVTYTVPSGSAGTSLMVT